MCPTKTKQNKTKSIGTFHKTHTIHLNQEPKTKVINDANLAYLDHLWRNFSMNDGKDLPWNEAT